ncbi:MAG: hypothetical protein H7Y15_19550 [Pseudonocardia sp.]|nr:hypothetical protein [Pseudonocardia sp.]
MTETTAPAITLDDIVAPGFVGDEPRRELICRGINHNDQGQLGTCSACGAQVVKRLGGKGGWCDPADHGHTIKFWCWGRHECKPDRVAAYRVAVLRDLARGVLYPRFPVVVARGRKVPVGTTGVLTWVGEGDYGLRAGIRTGDGATVWTAAGNVEVHVQGELAQQVAAGVATP